jgi:O-antigen ligase
VMVAALVTRSLVLKVACVGLGAFFVYLVIQTGSRMGILACITAAGAISLCFQASRKGLGRMSVVLVLAGALVAGTAYLWGSSEFSERYSALQQSLETGDFRAAGDLSLYGRAMLYKKAFELFLSSPLLGVGLDVFRTAGIEFRTIGNNAHSNYMEILAGTGLVGVLLYYAMYYFWWKRFLRARPLLKNPLIAPHLMVGISVAAALLVFDIAWVSYYEKLVMMVVAGLIAESTLAADARRHYLGS